MFESFEDAWHAARAIAQSGLWPANCRLLDHDEALVSGAGDGSRSFLVLAFESADHELDPWLGRAVEIARDHRGEVAASGGEGAQRTGAAGLWRDWFVRGGHVHDVMVRLSMIQETFETAVTWDRFPELHQRVLEATTRAVREECGVPGIVSCRFAYVYPDGPAPYYSVLAPATGSEPGERERRWAAIKAAASAALIEAGGTITHHHAVGRDHRPWYDRQRPELFAAALRACKRELDPGGIMNPGALIDP